MTDLVVHAPIDGWLCALAEVPDEAFAGGMVGEGAAIDPTGDHVVAPFDGVVAGLPASRHAVTERSADGVEVLIHVGLETVSLGGRGFTAHVAEGDAVRRGDLLLSLDLDVIADGVRSLVTPVIVVDGAGQISAISPGRAVRAGEPILRVSAKGERVSSETGPTLERTVRPALPHGLHARPAARNAA